jgi:hypothetical protein
VNSAENNPLFNLEKHMMFNFVLRREGIMGNGVVTIPARRNIYENAYLVTPARCNLKSNNNNDAMDYFFIIIRHYYYMQVIYSD